ncbi:MAG: SpoIIE family protein phosphatase [Acidobacteriota bacterium]|nr:SpoIIE family protein phosphatase [Acidobacteriota bacterium]
MPDGQNRQSIFPELIKSLIPITTMGKAMVIGIIVWFVNWAFAKGQTIFGSSTLKTLFDIASVLACIPLGYFAIKGARWVTQHLLWRLRRRLIVTYLLIGAVPIFLVVLLAALIGRVVVIQSSTSLVERQLDGYLEQARAATQAIGHDLSNVDSEQWQPERMQRRLQERADALAPIFPDIRLRLNQNAGFNVLVKGASIEGGKGAAAHPISKNTPRLIEIADLPEWLSAQGEFHGLVRDEESPDDSRIYALHVVKLKKPAQAVFQLSYPIGEGLCQHVSHTTNLKVVPGQAVTSLLMTPSGGRVDESVREGGEPGGADGVPIFKPVNEWRGGLQRERDVLVVAWSSLSIGSIWQRIQQFRTGSTVGDVLFVVIAGLAVISFLIALAAIVSAGFLTRSITGAVHHLYEGTKRVEAGDFDHEIKITGRDQLAALSGSFNQMTRSIRELLRVSAEKQRLDQEMKIAAQVQSLLFPRSTPKTAMLDFAAGVCIPARLVSGDYYDFIEVAPGITGVVVADVCGKGVSAALMMANLQANLRGQVQACHDAHSFKLSFAAQASAQAAVHASGPTGTQALYPRMADLSAHPVQHIVHRVNQQVAASVMDSSYITFFYAEFDEQRMTLRYTNAGHNPPLLLRAKINGEKKVECLDRGGTVLGLFYDVEYEDVELTLESGDVLVAFTDGLVEACNPEGEEFSEERVRQLLLRNAHLSAAEIEQQMLRAAKAWTHEAEQEDDLTLVIFKVK